MASLQQQLDEHRETSSAKRPAEIAERLGAAKRRLVEFGIADRALSVGARAPDFTLPEARGESVTLSELLARGPVVVAFYRGVW